MSVLKKVGKFLVGGVLGMLLGKPKQKQLPPPEASRDAALAAIDRDDRLRRRQGSAADMITGVGGSEPALAPGKFNIIGN